MTKLEEAARIIDPEAFGLPSFPLGEFGMSDRDEARAKARAVVEALRMPSLAMIEACFDACKSEVSHQNLVTAWRAMLDAILNETCAEPPVPP